MLDAGIISKSTSPWAFPLVTDTKSDGTQRLCVNFRPLNQRTKKDAWPMPNIDGLLEELQGSALFTTLDLFSGYWQIRLDERVKDLTSFRCKFGTFRFEVLPFGLQNAPAVFQRMMSELFADLRFVKVYLDDVIVHSKTEEEHIKHLEKVFVKLASHSLKIKVRKCKFLREQVRVLGHVVSRDGVSCDPDKIVKIKNWPRPDSKEEVLSFVSLGSYCRKFIKNFACLAKPLYDVSKGSMFHWTPEAELSFQLLKTIVTSPPVLAYPDYYRPFKVYADACGYGLGVILAQENDEGEEHPVAYASRTLVQSEKNYSVTDKEGLAVIFALKKYRHYLLPNKFQVVVDHQALRYMFTKAEATGRLGRWLALVSEFQMEVVYRKGRKHQNVDAMSRRRDKDEVDEEAVVELIEECKQGQLIVCKHIKESLNSYYPEHPIPASKNEGTCAAVVSSGEQGCGNVVALPVGAESVDAEIEQEVFEVLRYLVFGTVEGATDQVKIRRRSKRYKVIGGKLYRSTQEGLKVVLR